jgi:hypothetical protein
MCLPVEILEKSKPFSRDLGLILANLNTQLEIGRRHQKHESLNEDLHMFRLTSPAVAAKRFDQRNQPY